MLGTESEAASVYYGSHPGRTRSYLSRLSKCGALGRIAAQLFRAQKALSRAKQYRGGIKGVGSYRDLACERKDEAIRTLCEVLEQDGGGVVWGWGMDWTQRYAPHVLYVDIPGIGQVSFHSTIRRAGPDYPGEWDQTHETATGILALCDSVATGRGVRT